MFIFRLGGRRRGVEGRDLVRPAGLAIVGDEHVLHSIVFEIDLEEALFFGGLGSDAQDEFGDVVAKLDAFN